MDLYHKRSRIIADIFMKKYNEFIIIFTKYIKYYVCHYEFLGGNYCR